MHGSHGCQFRGLGIHQTVGPYAAGLEMPSMVFTQVLQYIYITQKPL